MREQDDQKDPYTGSVISRRTRVIAGAGALVAVLGLGAWGVASRHGNRFGTALDYHPRTPVLPAEASDRANADEIDPGAAPPPIGTGLPAGDIVTRTRSTPEGTIRITTARSDLSGLGDRLLAADDGQPAGPGRCTQNLRLGDDAPARKTPDMLLCWRTSAGRSVVTVAVARSGHPSVARSVAILNQEWAALR